MAAMCCRSSDTVKVSGLLAIGDLFSLVGAHDCVTSSYRSCHGLNCGATWVSVSVSRISCHGFDSLDDMFSPRPGMTSKFEESGVGDLVIVEAPGGRTPPCITGPL